MRIQFGNEIIKVNYVYNPFQDRFVDVNTPDGTYIIDCEEPNYASWLMSNMLTKGYFNATGVDYNNITNHPDPTWYEYCRNKTEEQKVFGKWINKNE